MSYRSWSRQNFQRQPLPARIWADLCRRGRAVRVAWRSRRAPAMKAPAYDCGECPMNGSSFCPCNNQPDTAKGTP